MEAVSASDWHWPDRLRGKALLRAAVLVIAMPTAWFGAMTVPNWISPNIHAEQDGGPCSYILESTFT
jgi:hypothetical protein